MLFVRLQHQRTAPPREQKAWWCVPDYRDQGYDGGSACLPRPQSKLVAGCMKTWEPRLGRDKNFSDLNM